MSSAKRNRPPDHHERIQPNKRPRPNQPSYNSATYDNNPPAYTHANPNGKLNARPNANGIARKPPQRSYPNVARTATHSHSQSHSHSHSHLQPHSPDDLQTTLVSLLDAFGAAETTSKADREVLRHVYELRRLLCARDHPARDQMMRELNEKRPDKAPPVKIPDYVEHTIAATKTLPPLPPIAEPHLHEAVFTHRSINAPYGQLLQPQDILLGLDYERLELLGDAYIELIASRALYNRFPHVDVPELCSWRERLVENSTLGKFSEAYGFPDRLRHHSQWEHNSKAWRKVVADIFEAYVAALVLADPKGGFATAEKWLTELWAPQLLGFREKIVENVKFKEELSRLICVKDIKLDYRQEKRMTYDAGSLQRFYFGVYLTGWGFEDEWLGSGEGQNKHEAATAAASAAVKNSPVVKVAAKLKAEIMEAREKAKEEAETSEATASTSPVPDVSTNDPGEATADVKKKKKHKKEK